MTLDQYGHLFAHDLGRIAEAMDSQLFTDSLSHGLVMRAQKGEQRQKITPYLCKQIGDSVEPPGIEPGSYAILPGLLRAQFVHDLLL